MAVKNILLLSSLMFFLVNPTVKAEEQEETITYEPPQETLINGIKESKVHTKTSQDIYGESWSGTAPR